jgi:adenylate cyclase
VPFVAVLPIVSRGSEELEILAEDLTEDITRELAQNSFFKVIAAGRVAALRGRAVDYEAVARQFDSRYLIEGKLQGAGENVRLTLQVVEAPTGGMLRSARFARNLADLDASPEEFPVAVACELGEQITRIETQRAMTMQGPMSGWDHVMRGLAFMERLGPSSERSALDEARKAVAAAPGLALAHALLANNIGSSAVYALVRIEDAERKEIHEHIRRAMQIDGDNPAILHFMTGAYASLGDSESALRLARRAVDLAPNTPLAQFGLAHACFAAGRTAEAIAAFKKQLRLAPHDLNRAAALMIQGISLLVEQEPAEAEDAFDRSLALNPDYCVGLAWKAIAAAQQGKDWVAKDTIMRLRDSEPTMTLDQHLRLLVYYPSYRERLSATATLFRRLWEETGGDG